MKIHWKASVTNPSAPVSNYLVQVQEKHEPEGWRNCTQTNKSLICTINDLKSNTAYDVRVAGRNIVGYSKFTVKEAQTLASEEEGEPKGETMPNILTTRLLRLKVVSTAGSYPGVLVTGRYQDVFNLVVVVGGGGGGGGWGMSM